LVADQGRRIHFRIDDRYYELSQEALRAALGLPDGPRGLGITIDRDRLHFEFAADQKEIELTADELQRRIAKHLALVDDRSRDSFWSRPPRWPPAVSCLVGFLCLALGSRMKTSIGGALLGGGIALVLVGIWDFARLSFVAWRRARAVFSTAIEPPNAPKREVS
jgi:hypothetical protein